MLSQHTRWIITVKGVYNSQASLLNRPHSSHAPLRSGLSITFCCAWTGKYSIIKNLQIEASVLLVH